MTWAAVAGGTIAGIGAIGGSLLNKPKGGGAAQYIEPSVYQPGDDLARAKADYAQSVFGGPAGPTADWNQYEPLLRKKQEQLLYERMYGSPGMQGPGTMQNVMSTGAITGVGPKATMAGMQKAMYDYNQSGAAIDEMMARMGYGSKENALNRAAGMSLPTHVQGQVVGGYPAQAQQDYIGPAMSALGGAIGGMDWGGGASQDPQMYNYTSQMTAPDGSTFTPSQSPYNLQYGNRGYTTSQPPAGSSPFSK